MTAELPVSAPLYELIYAVLRRHIADGQLPMGLVLGETSVARAFKASRIPAGAALRRLRDEGLVSEFGGRGYLTGPPGATPVRLDLAAAGFQLPAELEAQLSSRNRWEHIYPDVEHGIAACLAYGRFLLNESGLAEHYKVSRTVAHEVLAKLERTGIVTRDLNQRWYAGPMTARDIREHFEMRWLLEPIALRQAFPKLDRDDLKSKRARVARLSGKRPPPPEKLERIEHDLHIGVISHCDNTLLLATVTRSLLPLIATHATFDRYHEAAEITTMVAEHLAIFDNLISGDVDAAAALLERHLRGSLQPNLDIWQLLGPIPPDMLPAYMTPVTS